MQDMKQYTEKLPMVKTKTTNMQAFTYIVPVLPAKNSTLYPSITDPKRNSSAVDISTSTGFEEYPRVPGEAYNLTDFQVRSSVMFGDLPLAILDDND